MLRAVEKQSTTELRQVKDLKATINFFETKENLVSDLEMMHHIKFGRKQPPKKSVSFLFFEELNCEPFTSYIEH